MSTNTAHEQSNDENKVETFLAIAIAKAMQCNSKTIDEIGNY